jgi:hypothetical protein
MNSSTHDNNGSNKLIMPSVIQLATNVDKFKMWRASFDGQTNTSKILIIFFNAILADCSDVCQLIVETVSISDYQKAWLLRIACIAGRLPIVQLIVSRCTPSTQHLHTALASASAHGKVETVTWLLSVMQLSHSERVRWLLATAGACGNIDTVRLLAAQTGVTSTEAMSQALRVACYLGKVKVVDWLTTYTTADVSLCGELHELGSMTSLAAACHNGVNNVAVNLLQCVTPCTVNIQCGVHKDSALHSAIFYINENNKNHSLHNACSRHIDDVGNILYDADVDAIDHHSTTPLHLVCETGNANTMQLLLSVFARVDITDDNRQTSIDRAKITGYKEFVPYMSQLLDLSNYTPSSTSGVTRAAIDVIVSDVSIVASDVRSTVQPCTQCNTTTLRQQQRQSVKVAASNNKSRFYIV